MIKLKDLIDCDYNISISGITTDSRKVKSNYLFIAVKGYNVDHFDFIDDAIKNGAVAVVTDRTIVLDVPCIVVSDINQSLISICEKFYNISDEDLSLIGITGTDGKTTSASIIKQILNPCIKTAYIGTNGMEIDKHVINTSNTTPCVEELYKCFYNIKNHDCKSVVMEVSSESLLHGRVDSLKYDIVGYTNITEDHLNVHKTIDNYINCKKHLVDLLNDDGYLIVNGDCKNCKSIMYHNMYTYGFSSDNDCVISNVKICKDLTKFDILFKGNTYNISSPFTGNYNIYNVVLAFLVCYVKGLDISYIIEKISILKPISGRREYLDFGQKFDLVLDYAHTYNGIKNLITSFPGYRRIILVTGAAGGREKEKRKFIGKFVLENCDLVVFTMDDPRFENPTDIINDMLSDTNLTNYKIIIDRKKAIYYALDSANNDDLVLVIGKGRDNYMAIYDKKIKYCDYNVIKEYFNK